MTIMAAVVSPSCLARGALRLIEITSCTAKKSPQPTVWHNT